MKNQKICPATLKLNWKVSQRVTLAATLITKMCTKSISSWEISMMKTWSLTMTRMRVKRTPILIRMFTPKSQDQGGNKLKSSFRMKWIRSRTWRKRRSAPNYSIWLCLTKTSSNCKTWRRATLIRSSSTTRRAIKTSLVPSINNRSKETSLNRIKTCLGYLTSWMSPKFTILKTWIKKS